MNENVIRICHLGRTYTEIRFPFRWCWRPVKENWWRKRMVKGKWPPRKGNVYNERVKRRCVTVENAFNNDSHIHLIQYIHVPHRQMLKFAGYYCSNIWDSALSIIYANIREFTNSIVHASGGKIKFSNHIYVFTVEKCCFVFVCATRAIRVRRDIVLCI